MRELSLSAIDEEYMLTLAQQIASQLLMGLVVYLHGDLGAGKTTFARGLIRALGHSGPVKSPTYTLVEPYDLDFPVYHFDLYRLSDPEEFDYMGGRDYFNRASLSLIEWPSCGNGFIPPADIAIHISHAGPRRDIRLIAYSSQAEALLGLLT